MTIEENVPVPKDTLASVVNLSLAVWSLAVVKDSAVVMVSAQLAKMKRNSWDSVIVTPIGKDLNVVLLPAQK